MRVVFPEPLGPIRIVTFPDCKLNDRSSRAAKLPKVFLRDLISRILVRAYHAKKKGGKKEGLLSVLLR